MTARSRHVSRAAATPFAEYIDGEAWDGRLFQSGVAPGSLIDESVRVRAHNRFPLDCPLGDRRVSMTGPNSFASDAGLPPLRHLDGNMGSPLCSLPFRRHLMPVGLMVLPWPLGDAAA